MHIKFLLFFVLSITLLGSCKNEKKELSFSEIKKTLVKEFDWISGNIEKEYKQIEQYYIKEYKPQKITPLFTQSQDIYNQFKVVQSTMNKTPGTSLIYQIKTKSQSIDSAYNYYIELKQISEEIKKIEGIRDYYSSNYKVISVPEKVILSPNEPLKAKLMFCETNNFNPNVYFKSFVNKTEIPLINYKAEHIISGDSTKNMKPGKYEWNGEIVLSLNKKDSIFSFKESFYITPPICE
jgi:hypothetical protein